MTQTFKKNKKIEHMHSAIYYLSYGTVLNITWYTTWSSHRFNDTIVEASFSG